MWRGVSIKTAATGLPISVADFKSRLRVDHTDEDALIQSMLEGAVDMIDGPNGIGCAMMSQTWQKSMDVFPGTILLPGASVKTVSSIKYIDTAGVQQTLASSGYRVDILSEPCRITPAYHASWPGIRSVTGAVIVEYTLGEATADNVSRALIAATTLIAASHYENREAAGGRPQNEVPFGVQAILNRNSRISVSA